MPPHVFLLGKFHGQRSLAGYSPWGGKESDKTEWLRSSTSNNTLNIHVGPAGSPRVMYVEDRIRSLSCLTKAPLTHITFVWILNGFQNLWGGGEVRWDYQMLPFPQRAAGQFVVKTRLSSFFFFSPVRQNLHSVLRGEGKVGMSKRFWSLVSEAFSRKSLIRIG